MYIFKSIIYIIKSCILKIALALLFAALKQFLVRKLNINDKILTITDHKVLFNDIYYRCSGWLLFLFLLSANIPLKYAFLQDKGTNNQ